MPDAVSLSLGPCGLRRVPMAAIDDWAYVSDSTEACIQLGKKWKLVVRLHELSGEVLIVCVSHDRWMAAAVYLLQIDNRNTWARRMLYCFPF